MPWFDPVDQPSKVPPLIDQDAMKNQNSDPVLSQSYPRVWFTLPDKCQPKVLPLNIF